MAAKFTGAGAWATAAEEEEEEAKKQAKMFPVPMAAVKDQDAESAFPSLGDAVAGLKGKKKKEKQTVTLSEFHTGTRRGLGSRIIESQGLTMQEQLTLPKGPRDRSGEEDYDPNKLGGAFRSYGAYRGGGGGGGRGGYGDEERGGGGTGAGYRGGYGEGYGDERGIGDRSRDRMEDMPSRADESDNWGAGKRFTPSQSMREPARGGGGGGFFSGGDRSDRYGEDRVSDRDLPSRADEVDNWGANKKITASQSFNLDRRSYGSRYEDDRRSVPEPEGPSRADGEWGRRFTPGPMTRSYDSFEGGDRWRPAAAAAARPEGPPPSERPRLNLAKRTLPSSAAASAVVTAPKEGDTVRPIKPSPFGSAKPREEVLMEKGQDWRRLDAELEHRDLRKSWDRLERPITPEGSTAGSVGSGQGLPPAAAATAVALASATVPVKPKPKPNPFGDAKPREYVLEEKGQDWRKMEFELEHKGVDRPETEEEKNLREEIAGLEIALKEKERGGGGGGGGVASGYEEKKENGFAPGSSDASAARPPSSEGLTLKELLAKKERELESLTRALDDRVRFAQRGIGGDRFGRGPRPPAAGEERPRSRAGSVEERERPRSSYSDRERFDRYADSRDRAGSFDSEREREAVGRGVAAAAAPERSAPPAVGGGGAGTNPKASWYSSPWQSSRERDRDGSFGRWR